MKTILCALAALSTLVCAGPAAGEALQKEPPAEKQQALLAAFAKLDAFIRRDREPAPAEVAPVKKLLNAHKESYGSSAATIKAALAVVGAYDEIKGPLFVARGGWSKGRAKRGQKAPSLPADIHNTIYDVMQNVFDHVYTPENIAAHADMLKGFSFGSHKHFPGPVEPPEKEKIDTHVSLDKFLATPHRI